MSQSVNLNSSLPAAAVFASAVSAASESTLVNPRTALFASAVNSKAEPSVSHTGTAAFASALNATCQPRVDLEPNITGTAVFSSAVNAASQSVLQTLGGAVFASVVNTTAQSEIIATEEFGFTIIVDVLDSAVATAGNVRRHRPRLLADGVEVPIRAFSVNAPAGEVGKSASFTLSKADISLVSSTADLDFDLGVWNGSAFIYQPIIQNGRLQGRGRTIQLNQDLTPGDAVEISTRDVLAERIAKAPAAPQIIYNPDLLTETPQTDTRNALQDENGNAIVPQMTAVSGLRLHDCLNRAYVQGCGFSSVVTNLPNFQVSRVEFSLEGGYDGGVRSLLNLFEPIFDVQGEVLWIIDPDASVPTGITPRSLPLSSVVRVSDQLPASEKFDGIIVSYNERQSSASGEYFTERFEPTEIITAGTFGSPGYTRTEIVRKLREYRNVSNPSVVLRAVLTETKQSVYNNNSEIVSRETQTEQFDALGRKTGHTRNVEALVPALPAPDLFLNTIFTENCSIGYQPNPFNSNEQIQSTTTIYQAGLVLVDNDNTNPLNDAPQKIPLAEAKINYLIDPAGNQVIQTLPIRTIKKQLKVLSDGQLNLSVQTYNHLENTPERTTSEPVPGSNSLGDVRLLNQKRVLLRAGATVTKRVSSFDGGDLPRDVAAALGRRKLSRLNSPPRTATADLPFVDLSVRRGSVFNVAARSGNVGTFYVTGFSISGANLGDANQLLTMSLEKREIV